MAILVAMATLNFKVDLLNDNASKTTDPYSV